MEIGSHDHLVEGALSQAPTNGVNRHLAGEEGDVSRGEAGGGGSGGGCVPHPQAWGTGVTSHEKASYPQAQQQQQQPDCWSRGTLNAVDMEDARNLVAFSASAGIAPSSSHSEPQPCTTQLYEKFSQEMADKNAGPPGWGTENDRSLPMDINTLQTALSRAKHGHKPPNCDCDGPDCPDYLEWLEKKIKLASDSQQDKTHCKVSEALQSHPQPQPQSLHPHQPNGLSCGPGAPPQALCERPPAPIQCALPPIPCSPSVLSIAKEKNISLETAIALEALTQLSAPQSSSPSASSMPQHQQQASHSWEQQRAQSKGEVPRMMMPHHPTPYSPSVSPFQDGGTRSPMPQQQWQQQQQLQLQGPPRGNSPRTPWMLNNPESQVRFAPPTSGSGGGSGDPMSELKQLLGDGSAKHTNAGFRFPTPQPLPNDKAGPRTPTIKQEVDSGDYLNAAMARYAMTNGQQQQYPPSPLSPAALSIRHSTQAALQQHLHHKRNLFSSPPAPGPRGPVACQNLRKWWPQMGPMMGPDMMSMPMSMPMMPGIKQEPKEPKKKMSQSSPLGTKLGPPLPKPKQIVIKKVKQKASQPVFLPQNQIVVQKAAAKAQAQALAMPFLPGMEAGSAVPGALPFPIPNPSLAVAASVPPAQSQESILNSSSVVSSASSSSGVTAGIPSPASVPLSIGPAVPQNGSATSGTPDGTLAPSTSTPQTSTEVAAATAQPAPLLTGLSSLDPKFEDLIRQFEEEFGETPSSSTAPTSDASSSASASVTATNSPQAQARAEGSGQPETMTQQQPLQDANSGQAKPTSPPTELPAIQSDGQQAMEVGEQAESSVASEGAPSASVSASTQSPAAASQISQQGSELPSPSPSTATAAPPVSVSQNALLEQWQTLQDPFATPGSPSSKRIKLETNGGVTVLSTTTSCFTPGGEDDTPTKDGLPMTPSLKGFLESPLCYLDTPTKNLLDTPMKTEAEFPLCDCVGK